MKKTYLIIDDKSEEVKQLAALLQTLPGTNHVELVTDLPRPDNIPEQPGHQMVFAFLPAWSRQTRSVKSMIASRMPVVLLVKEYEKFYNPDDFDSSVFLQAPFKQEALLQLIDQHNRPGTSGHPGNDTVLNAFYIKYNRCLKRIFFRDLQYVEAWGNYIRIYTPARKFVIAYSLNNLYQQLPKEQFIRVHRSYIVPQASIHTLKRNQIWLGEQSIPVSKKGMKLIKQVIQKAAHKEVQV